MFNKVLAPRKSGRKLVALATTFSLLMPITTYAQADSTANITTPSTESCTVTAEVTSEWSVQIPKKLNLQKLGGTVKNY